MPAPRPRSRRARMGARRCCSRTAIETLGQMSCNPSIGGIGKGHLVQGGRRAGRRDGDRDRRGRHPVPHPQSPARARRCAPRARRPIACSTAHAIRARLENQPNLWLFQQAVDDLIVEGDRVVGAVTADRACASRRRAVVLTTGTFLAGLIHVGLAELPGRARRRSAVAVASRARLRELELPVGRLKTGTPPRIDGRSIDFSALAEQPGDDPVPVFSFLGPAARASAPGAVLDHAHQRAHPRHHPRRARSLADVHRRHRRRGAALLPVDRRQDPPLRRQGRAPDLPRARRPDDQRVLPQRHLDEPAVRRAAARSCARSRASRTRTSCGPATRSNTTTSIRAA